ncbi:MAG: helix-turn-helix domain-containing protein [Dehalococcoidia bacterium]
MRELANEELASALTGIEAEGTLIDRIQAELGVLARRIDQGVVTVDMHFAAFLAATSRFGYFTYGPVTIDARMIEEIVERTTPRRAPGEPWRWAMGDSNARFASVLSKEVAKSGRRRLDELHYLLAFMRTDEGLPKRVFGELGVTAAEIEEYARNQAQPESPVEKLYSPEEAADYLGVHVKTVRGWIRDGRLRASRLAGQRALRIRSSDLQAVLEPLQPGEQA